MRRDLKPLNQTVLDLSRSLLSGAEGKLSDSGIRVISGTPNAFLTSKDKLLCDAASDIALEADLSRSSDGWMKVSWSQTPDFSESKLLRRWYRGGLVKAQFAFPNSHDGIYWRFYPGASAEIRKVTAYCVP
jgi:hypothetical protein